MIKLFVVAWQSSRITGYVGASYGISNICIGLEGLYETSAGEKYGKLALDLILLALQALVYQKSVISMSFHEIGGLVLIGLFVLHKALNWKWIRSVIPGLLRRRIRLNALWLIDVLLLVSMMAVFLTGLLISKTLPTALEGAFFLKPWHYFFSALSLALTGIHLGLHWPLLRSTVWNKLPLKGRARTAVGAALLAVVLCLGVYALATTSVFSWLRQPFFSTMPLADGMPVPGEGHGELEGHELPEDFDWPDGTSPDGEFPMSKGTHEEGGGKGMGRGSGKGHGKGAMEPHEISHARVLSTLVKYASVVLFAAAVTAFIRVKLIPGRRKKAQGET